MSNVFVKHWRLMAIAVGAVLLLLVLYALRVVLFPFAIGLILAYLLVPVVRWLEAYLPPRKKWPGFRRVMAVLIVFILLAALIGGFLYVVVTAVVDASLVLVESAPYFIGQSVLRVQQWFEGIFTNLPAGFQEEMGLDFITGGVSIGNALRDALVNSVPSIPGTFNIVLGFAVLPFFLFYLLKDSDRLKSGVAGAFPEAARFHGSNLLHIVERVIGRYVRAQLMLGFIVGYFSFIGLLILDVPFALALALLAGVAEMIPNIGPWISGIVAGVVTLAMAPEKVIWVVVLFVGIQVLENNLLVPKIQSAYLRIHPAIMIFLLVFGVYVAGFWGILLIGPLTALVVEIIKYIRQCLRSEQCPDISLEE